MIEFILCGLLIIAPLGEMPETPPLQTKTASPEGASGTRPAADASTLSEAERLSAELKHSEALALFQKAAKSDPSNARAWNGIGLCYFYMEDIEKAIEAFKKASELDPGLSSVYYNLAQCYISKKQWDLAIIQLKKAVRDNPKNAPALFDLASVYFVKKDFKRAKENYEKAAMLFGQETPQGERALRNAIKTEMLMKRIAE